MGKKLSHNPVHWGKNSYPAPAPTNAPVIIGLAQEGNSLSSTTGTWDGTPTSYAYQWSRATSNISGATNSTYTCQSADIGSTLTVTVTASSSNGSAAATSVPTAAVIPALPTISVLPAISGTAQEGQTLSASTGTWLGTVVGYTYQWKRAGVSISGATAPSYIVQSGDVGSALTVTVTATNLTGSASATSSATTPVISAGSLPANTVLPVISGTDTEGQTLSTTDGTWSGTPTSYAYQWKRGTSSISGATSSTYALQAADVGSLISAVVTATNALGSSAVTSLATAAIIAASAPSNSVLPAITGTATVGQTLTASHGTWSESPTGYTYQWKRGGVSISAATATTYTVQQADVGGTLTVAVTATNSAGSTSATSSATATVAGASTVSFGALTQYGKGGYPVSATSISSGNSSGHWQVASGYLSPSSAGDIADLNQGPYSLILNDGTVVNITIEADVAHVRTTTEATGLDLVIGTTPWKAKTIKVRRDSYRGGASVSFGVDGTNTKLKSGDFLGLTIEGETDAINGFVRADDPCTIDKFIFTDGSNITFRKLATTRVAETKLWWKGSTLGTTGVTIDQCHIAGVTADANGDYSTSTNYPNYGITLVKNGGSISGKVGSSTFTNNIVEDGDYLYNVGADKTADATITCTGNFFQRAYSDLVHFSNGAGQAATKAIIKDNYFTLVLGNLADSATPHSDGIQGQGATNSAYDLEVDITGNVFNDGNGRGGMHGIFLASLKLGGVDSGHFYKGTIAGNLFIGNHNDAITVSQAGAITVTNNTCVQINNTTTNNNVTIRVGGTGDGTVQAGGVQTVTNNVADYINTSALSGATVSGNVALGQGGASTSYSAAFVGTGGFTSAPATKAAAIARFTAKSAGPLISTPYNLGAVGYVTGPA